MPLSFATRLAAFKSPVYERLRPAQKHILEEYAAHHSSTPDVAVELATGLGKTLIALLIADWHLEQGRTVAILSATRQLAGQVEDQASDLGKGLRIVRFWGGHYPGADLADYHDGQAVGVMNYWVYFNSTPVVQPADVLILDDAHAAEQPLVSLFTLRIPHRGFSTELYEQICELVLERTPAYANLHAMHDGAADPGTPPELLSFVDWCAIANRAGALITTSGYLAQDKDAQYPWQSLRPNIERCGVLIGPSAIEIRPYHPPTQTIRHYVQAQQCLYMSATLGTMDDLQRRLGIRPVQRIDVPAELTRQQTGRRLFLINPASERSLEGTPFTFAMQEAAATPRTAWLCASLAEAEHLEGLLRSQHQRVFTIAGRRDDGPLDEWRSAPAGHLIAAGRFDGLDLAGDVCRLVILPTVPYGSTEFERFVTAYLADATFMRHRVGQRVTQALGRANRDRDDWAIYLGLDPFFARILADPHVAASLGPEVRPIVRAALELHDKPWEQLQEATGAFRRGEDVVAPAGGRPGRGRAGLSEVTSASHEVQASTHLWLGAFAEAAREAGAAATALKDAGELEHGAFWKYVEAHAHWLEGTARSRAAAAAAMSTAVESAPYTAWFTRLRRTLLVMQGERTQLAEHDDLFYSWEQWLREAGTGAVTHVEHALRQLQGTHDDQAAALEALAPLCGAKGERPRGSGATDVIWSWATPTGSERRVIEIKTGLAAGAVTRTDVNQLLGQVVVERQRAGRHNVVGCLVTPHTTMEQAAAAAARELAVISVDALRELLSFLRERFAEYAAERGEGTTIERGHARSEVEPRLPKVGWLNRLLAASGGACRTVSDVNNELDH